MVSSISSSHAWPDGFSPKLGVCMGGSPELGYGRFSPSSAFLELGSFPCISASFELGSVMDGGSYARRRRARHRPSWMSIRCSTFYPWKGSSTSLMLVSSALFHAWEIGRLAAYRMGGILERFGTSL
ncbi:hypothetical protein Dimus_033113 [Dionaea muscipula]